PSAAQGGRPGGAGSGRVGPGRSPVTASAQDRHTPDRSRCAAPHPAHPPGRTRSSREATSGARPVGCRPAAGGPAVGDPDDVAAPDRGPTGCDTLSAYSAKNGARGSTPSAGGSVASSSTWILDGPLE